MLIDLTLLPLGIVKGLLIGGVPAVCQELRQWPRDFVSNWRAAGWISERSNSICVKEESESFPYEAVLHLARSSCHCQRSGPDVDANAHLGCCMVGRAQAYLGMHVTPLPLYAAKEPKP
jgi:hypothetical protein